MAGSPLKRQRRLGICREDGTVIPFPRFTHPRAGLSHAEWRALSPSEKLERLFRLPLAEIAAILMWPTDELDPHQLAVWAQVHRVVFRIGAKALLAGKLG
jgi:hypothetical protein